MNGFCIIRFTTVDLGQQQTDEKRPASEDRTKICFQHTLLSRV
jgi:hypothetical protein